MRRVRVIVTTRTFQLLAITLAILYAAATTNNGATYLLAFALIALGCVGMVQGVRNLSGLHARVADLSHSYGGAPGENDAHCYIRVALHHENKAPSYGLEVRLPAYGKVSGMVPVLEPEAMGEVNLRLSGLPRGIYPLRELEVTSIYPFGFGRLGRRFALPPCEFAIYPSPVEGDPLPAGNIVSSGSDGTGLLGDDFIGVRAHQEGESHRHVDWKAVSRGHPMMVKQFGGGDNGVVMLEWSRTHGTREHRLSVLAHWLRELERLGHRYGLTLPDAEVHPGNGSAHLHRTLWLLAGFPREEPEHRGLLGRWRPSPHLFRTGGKP